MKKTVIIIGFCLYAAVLLRCVNSSQPVATYARFHFEKGMKLEDKGHIQKAMKAYEQALYHNPSHAESCYRLGRMHKALGENDIMLHYYAKAIDFGFTKDPRIYYELGRFQLNNKRFDESKMLFLKTLELIHIYENQEQKHTMADANYGLAQIYFQEKDIKKAKVHLEKCTSFNVDLREAQLQLAGILLKNGEINEIITRISRLRKAGRNSLADELNSRFIEKK